MRMKRIGIVWGLCALLIAGYTAAQSRRGVPATPRPIVRVQPDGDTLLVRLHGDERKHWATTDDGYWVIENANGVLCYALRDKNGTVIASRKQAHNADKRTRCEQKYIQRKNIIR